MTDTRKIPGHHPTQTAAHIDAVHLYERVKELEDEVERLKDDKALLNTCIDGMRNLEGKNLEEIVELRAKLAAHEEAMRAAIHIPYQAAKILRARLEEKKS